MKKVIRAILAFTLFMPLWACMMFGLMIFPGIIGIFLGLVDIVGQCLKLLFRDGLTEEDRRDAAISMEMSLSVMFLPLIVPMSKCYDFIKCGKISFE